MKAEVITDTMIEEPKSEIVIELPGGRRISSNEYYHDTDKRGDSIIVIKAGRALGK